MPLRPRVSGALLAFALAAACAPRPGSAAAVRVIASDDHGITLKLDVPRWSLHPGAGGRADLVVPDFAVASDSGRPLLPFAHVLVALPQGASARARVVSADPESLLEGIRLTLQGRPVMRDDHGPLGPQPSLEPAMPVVDGPWPRSAVRVGAPFTLR